MGVRIQVQDSLDNLTLVDCEWSHLEVLLANEHYGTAQNPQHFEGRNNTFNRSFVCDVILKKILTLPALEKPTGYPDQHAQLDDIYAAHTPTLGQLNGNAK